MNEHFKQLVKRYPELTPLENSLEQGLTLLKDCARANGKIMVCGNGGSAADAEHIVGELMKGFLLKRPLQSDLRKSLERASPVHGPDLADKLQRGIAAVSLSSGVSLPTAFCNDVDARLCFAQQVAGLGRPGDVLWGISTSGNSANVNFALVTARAMGVKTLGLSGRDGGEMAQWCDVEIRVPADSTPIIQELHLPVYHALCAALEAELFG